MYRLVCEIEKDIINYFLTYLYGIYKLIIDNGNCNIR